MSGWVTDEPVCACVSKERGREGEGTLFLNRQRQIVRTPTKFQKKLLIDGFRKSLQSPTRDIVIIGIILGYTEYATLLVPSLFLVDNLTLSSWSIRWDTFRVTYYRS
jgi:hypothetical protein